MVAGTDGFSLRRWNCGGRRAARHRRSLDFFLSRSFLLARLFVVLVMGTPIARRWEKKPTRCDPKCGQRVGAEAALLEDDRLSMVSEAGVRETDRLFTELEAGALETDRLCTELEGGAFETDRPSAVSETSASMVRASASRRRVSGAGESQRGRRAAWQVDAWFRPLRRRARAERGVQRAEAGSDSFENFVAAFDPCESHVTRADRVNVILHEQQSQNSQTLNSHCTLARSLHDVHVARCVQNSSNSLGDGVVRGRCVCVPGETKSLSTSGVRRSAVCVRSYTADALKMHVETWAGLLRNQGPKIFREVEIWSLS